MCLIVVAFRVIRGCPVFLAGNREEIRTRPSAAPETIRDESGIAWLGGRDGIAGGTWLGVNSHGLLIAVTNRKDRPVPAVPFSRGLLCRELLGCDSVEQAVRQCRHLLKTKAFAGFNLLAISPQEATVVEAGAELKFHNLPSGLHVLTNSGLNVAEDARGQHARALFAEMLEQPYGKYDELVQKTTSICGWTSDDGAQPDICLTGGDHGTVSATVAALTDDPSRAEYWFADGPPSDTPFQSYSEQLRGLLNSRRNITSHRIKMKGPWEFAWNDDSLPCPAVTSGRVTMPEDWKSLFGDIAGRATFRRRFNCPTNLTPNDRVFITFDGVGGNGTVSLNKTVIGDVESSGNPQRLDITSALQSYNELSITLDYAPDRDGDPGGLYAPAALLIESPVA